MMIEPHRGTGGGNCMTTGCMVDLNAACPTELKVMSNGGGVACKSACEAFGDPQYCCSGTYASPDTCKPSSYSQFFKSACPRAYSYAYDDGTSTFTCDSTDYIISFCPSGLISSSTQSRNEKSPTSSIDSGNEKSPLPEEMDISRGHVNFTANNVMIAAIISFVLIVFLW
jgi:hypothetical protein